MITLNKFQITKALLIFAGGLLGLLGFWLFLNPGTFQGYEELRKFFISRLVKFEPVPAASYNPLLISSNIIYVLGGSPQILEGRFKTASDLYKSGMAKKILIHGSPTMMEFDPSIRRNLTFNEWALGKLIGLGVKKEDIEPVSTETGLFGTYSEARTISNIVLIKGCKTLILVSSKYHTERVWESFSKFNKNRKLNLYVYTSEDDPDMPALFLEYLKLMAYRSFLL
jgi:vancomycin permeability regulator SanA